MASRRQHAPRPHTIDPRQCLPGVKPCAPRSTTEASCSWVGGMHRHRHERVCVKRRVKPRCKPRSSGRSRVYTVRWRRGVKRYRGGVYTLFFTREYRRAPCDILRDNGAHPKADRHARHPCTHRSASMSQLGPRSLARHERAQRARTLTRTPLSHSPPPRPTRSPSLHISPTAARAQKVHDREHQPCSPGAFSRSRSPARTLSTTKSPPPAASSHRSPTRGSAAAVSQRAVDGSGRGAERSRVESTRVRVAWRGVA